MRKVEMGGGGDNTTLLVGGLDHLCCLFKLLRSPLHSSGHRESKADVIPALLELTF
jgi:hypothetical protein